MTIAKILLAGTICFASLAGANSNKIPSMRLAVQILPDCLVNPVPRPTSGSANPASFELTTGANPFGPAAGAAGAAIVAILAPALIDLVVTGIGTAIKEAGKESETFMTDRSALFLYGAKLDDNEEYLAPILNDNHKCVVIAVGDTQTSSDRFPDFYDTLITPGPSGTDKRTLKKHLSDAMGIKTEPRAFLELRVIAVQDKERAASPRYWTLAPQTAFIPKGKTETVAITINLSRPGAGADESLSLWTFDLSTFKSSGLNYPKVNKRPPQDLIQPYGSLPALTEAEAKLFEEYNKIVDSAKSALAQEKSKQDAEDERRVAKDDGEGGTGEVFKDTLPGRSLELDKRIVDVRTKLSKLQTDDKGRDPLDRELTFLRKLILEQREFDRMEAVYNSKIAAAAAEAKNENKEEKTKAKKARLAKQLSASGFLNMTVTASVTKEQNDFLTKLGDLISGKAESIATAASDALIVTRSEKINAIETHATAEVDTLTAITNFRVARELSQDQNAGDTERLDARSAFIKASAACRVLQLRGGSLPECAALPSNYTGF